MFNYEDYLFEKLSILKNDLSIDCKIEISTEQMFAKKKNLVPNSIYVVIKYLTNNISFGVKTQPIQIMVLSEQNSIDNVKMLFNRFTNDYNWQLIQSDEVMVKQQYVSPVVMNNFNEVAYGYRSLLYVSGTLYIMENFVDVKNLKIDGVDVSPLTFGLNYSMSGNTQPVGGSKIATTTKSMSTLGISMAIPMIDIEDGFLYDVLKIMNGSETGNKNFGISFVIGEVNFSLNMKLTSSQIATAPNEVPSIQLSFMA